MAARQLGCLCIVCPLFRMLSQVSFLCHFIAMAGIDANVVQSGYNEEDFTNCTSYTLNNKESVPKNINVDNSTLLCADFMKARPCLPCQNLPHKCFDIMWWTCLRAHGIGKSMVKSLFAPGVFCEVLGLFHNSLESTAG